jgi:hypothetical protein
MSTEPLALSLLAEQFELLNAELDAARDCHGIIEDAYYEELERLATWPEDQEKWSSEDARAFCNARGRIERETDVGKAYVKSCDAIEACYRKLDPVCNEIKLVEARTPAEQHLRMLAVAVQLGDDPAELWS